MKSYKQNFFVKNKIAIIILVRLKSKRLEQKALLKLHNIKIIELLIKRILKKFPNKCIYICTDNKNNDPLKVIAKMYKINFFRGSEINIFKRIIDMRKKYKFQHFVRVTGDNPFTNTEAIKKMSIDHVKNQNDFTYTNSLPIGTRPEIISYEALKKANDLAIDPNSSEYMTYFFKRKIFKKEKIFFKKKFPKQDLYQITIDTISDYNNVVKNFKATELLISDKKILNKISQFNKKYITKRTRGLRIKTSKYDVSFKGGIANKILN
tara:strand:+ start:1006 stop:1800 length:795 start_codon:yes stop_codon:yes gene_type:complete